MKVKELIKILKQQFDGDEKVELDNGDDVEIIQRFDECCSLKCAIVSKEEE